MELPATKDIPVGCHSRQISLKRYNIASLKLYIMFRCGIKQEIWNVCILILCWVHFDFDCMQCLASHSLKDLPITQIDPLKFPIKHCIFLKQMLGMNFIIHLGILPSIPHHLPPIHPNLLTQHRTIPPLIPPNPHNPSHPNRHHHHHHAPLPLGHHHQAIAQPHNHMLIHLLVHPRNIDLTFADGALPDDGREVVADGEEQQREFEVEEEDHEDGEGGEVGVLLGLRDGLFFADQAAVQLLGVYGVLHQILWRGREYHQEGRSLQDVSEAVFFAEFAQDGGRVELGEVTLVVPFCVELEGVVRVVRVFQDPALQVFEEDFSVFDVLLEIIKCFCDLQLIIQSLLRVLRYRNLHTPLQLLIDLPIPTKTLHFLEQIILAFPVLPVDSQPPLLVEPPFFDDCHCLDLVMSIRTLPTNMHPLITDKTQQSQHLQSLPSPHLINQIPHNLVVAGIGASHREELLAGQAVQQGVDVRLYGQHPRGLREELAEAECAELHRVQLAVLQVEGEFAFEEEVGWEIGVHSMLEQDLAVAAPVLIYQVHCIMDQILREIPPHQQLLQKLPIDTGQQLMPKFLRQLADHLLLDLPIPIPLLTPNKLKIGPYFNLQFLSNLLLTHKLINRHKLQLEIRLTGLRLQQNLNNAIENIREGYTRYHQHEDNIELRHNNLYSFERIQRRDIPVGNRRHRRQRPIHRVFVLQVPRQVDDHLAVGLGIVQPAPCRGVRPVVVCIVHVQVDGVEDPAEVVAAHYHDHYQARDEVGCASGAVELKDALQGLVDQVQVEEFQEEEDFYVVENV